MNDRLLNGLQEITGSGGILTGEDVSARHASWGRPGGSQAMAIVRPVSTRQVSEILKLCNRAEVAVVPQGGMTGLVDGGVTRPGEIALSLERMTAIESLDVSNRSMTVQAGLALEAAQSAADAAGLMFAVDLGARGSATIGGNISTNAGGVQVIRYGMMRENVLGLEAVLADGTVIDALNKAVKNNAGYDIKQLFVGSEGTLGIVTRAVLRLRARPRSQVTALLAVENLAAVFELLARLDAGLAGALSSFELMSSDYYRLMTAPPAPHRAPLGRDFPYYVLVESRGGQQDEDEARMEALLTESLQDATLLDAAVARSESQSRDFWRIREDVEQMWRFEPLFNFDVSLALEDMESYARDVRDQLRRQWSTPRFFLFGHIGDGNLHLCISTGREGDRHAVEAAVYKTLKPYAGSISAEHGIGLEKKPWLDISRSAASIDLMSTLKRALDPKNTLNPGKVVPSGRFDAAQGTPLHSRH